MRYLISFVLTLVCLFVTAQESPINKYADSLLSAEISPEHPGWATGVIQEGEVIYLNAGGKADLDRNIDNTTKTKFQIGRLSNQFTVYTFLHLIDQSALTLETNIRDFIKELPAYDHPILVKHLLNHTTGLNDFNAIISMTGTSLNAAINNQQAIDLISKQTKLSFKPGADFSIYDSVSEIILMVALIERVSNQSFEEYFYENVARPLGLNNTEFIRNGNVRQSDIARAYALSETTSAYIPNNRTIVGPTNLYTNAEDLAKWYTLLSEQNSNTKNLLVKQLDTPVTNDDGHVYHSSWGEMTFGRAFLHAERGIPKYWQYGLVAGYGANVFRYPEQDLTSFVLGNNNRYNGAPAINIITPIIEQHYKAPRIVDFNLIKTVTLSNDQLKTHEGQYFGSASGWKREIKLLDDTLRSITRNRSVALIPLSENKFQAQVQSDDVVIFDFTNSTKNKELSISSGGSRPTNFKRYTTHIYNEEEKEDFVGTYVNISHDQIFEISKREGQLFLVNSKLGLLPIESTIEDTFATNQYPINSIQMIREDDKVVGFNIKSESIDHVYFSKVSMRSDDLFVK